ncbi:MAG: POTRA domain-containing protein [Bacteroidales bacterium]|nr:POTRA domain-containing protein [Bacteroidales bacterium]
MFHKKFIQLGKYQLLVFFVCCFFISYGQTDYSLEIETTSGERIDYNYRKLFSTENERLKEINKLIQFYYAQGYLAFSVDSSESDSLKSKLYIHTGERFHWIKINTSDSDFNIITQSKVKTEEFKGEVVNFKVLRDAMKKILSYLENNGYPFASVFLDSVNFSENAIEAHLMIDKNVLIRIDSLRIEGNAAISSSFLENYLSIRKNDIYNEQNIKSIDKKLSSLNFISLRKETEVFFYDSSCVIVIYIDKKSANNFDGILGIIPDNETGKISLTGDIRFKLHNAFKRAEEAEINWKQFEKGSSRLFLHFAYPYILSTHLGIDYSFNLLKRDSSYMSLSHVAGLSYLYSSSDRLRFFGDFRKSYTINLPTTSTDGTLGNFNLNLFGLGWVKEQLDYRLNPSKGYLLDMSVAGGFKRSDTLNAISSVTSVEKQQQYHIYFHSQLYLNPFKRNVIMLRTQFNYISGQNFYENELNRIGGLKTLRGFDDESIYASAYSIITLEYRYLFQRNAYINVFWDGAYYEKNTYKERVLDRPYGFGAGLSFETRQGIFSINYAVGKQFDNPIQFKFAKIHFGLINTF